MKSDDPETDKTVSIRQIQPLLARSVPRVIAPITDKKGEHERDNGGVAKATITHSESGKKDRKKLRRLVSELTLMEVKKSKDKGKRRKAIRVPSVDTSQARGSSDVVRLAIKELGWREYPTGRRHGCDFYWLGGHFEMPEYTETGWLSKFFGMSEAAHKVELTRHINRLHFLFPHEFSFYPKTWMLPEEFGEVSAYMSKAKKPPTLIVKPDGGSQGDGIFLMQNIHDVHLSTALARPCVVQEYVAEPYLLEKFKFDLRIYVVLKRLEPLEIFICREGMARFCTEHYQPPTHKNISKTYMHLTNYSLNKHSAGYVQSDAEDKGSKRKISAVFKQLEKQGCNIPLLWAEIDQLACKTVIALLPILKLQTQIISAELKQDLRSFQILGFDILLNKDLKPILLEVNSSPSLRIDYEEETVPGKVDYYVSKTDLEIKLPIVKDTMSLVWQQKKVDTLPEKSGCLYQIYPKLASHLDHFRVVERCVTLFRHFVGVRTSNKMGPTSFRMMARRCHLTDFGFTLASFDIMFINMSRRHPGCESGRASLNFHGFYESLIAIGHKKFALTMRKEPVQILLNVLKHCEHHLEKNVNASQRRKMPEPYLRPSLGDRKLLSCFQFPLATSSLF